MSIYSDKLAHLQVVINCPYFVAPICTREDVLTDNKGAPYIDDVMSYNSLTTQLFTFPFLVSPSQFGEMTFVYWKDKKQDEENKIK